MTGQWWFSGQSLKHRTTLQVKSFVDDLVKERGTVSMRVAFVLRSAEVLPLFL